MRDVIVSGISKGKLCTGGARVRGLVEGDKLNFETALEIATRSPFNKNRIIHVSDLSTAGYHVGPRRTRKMRTPLDFPIMLNKPARQ